MGLCWSSRLGASTARSKLNLPPTFLLRAVRIGIDAWKTFRELTGSPAEGGARAKIGGNGTLNGGRHAELTVRIPALGFVRRGVDRVSLGLLI